MTAWTNAAEALGYVQPGYVNAGYVVFIWDVWDESALPHSTAWTPATEAAPAWTEQP